MQRCERHTMPGQDGAKPRQDYEITIPVKKPQVNYRAPLFGHSGVGQDLPWHPVSSSPPGQVLATIQFDEGNLTDSLSEPLYSAAHSSILMGMAAGPAKMISSDLLD